MLHAMQGNAKWKRGVKVKNVCVCKRKVNEYEVQAT